MVSENPAVERQIRETAVLDEHQPLHRDGTRVRTQPTAADAVMHSYEHRGSIIVDDPIVGRAAREVVRTCEEYDVPIEPRDVTVVAVRNHTANASATAYGCGEFVAEGGLNNSWSVEEEPDGYIVYIAMNRMGGLSFGELVRHELAHICNWAEDRVTHEQCMNHAEWLDRLDTR